MWQARDLGVWGDAQLVVINSIGAESGMPELTEGVSLPVLQDVDAVQAFTTFGAEKWYMYFIDAQGVLRALHYELHLPDGEARMLELLALAQEAR